MIAAADHGYTDMAVLLLDKGARPNVRDLSRETPLSYAARYGYGEVVSLLLRRGADPNAKDNRGWSPLRYHCIRGDTDLMPVLLDAGADINAPDDHDETPLMYAGCRQSLRHRADAAPAPRRPEHPWLRRCQRARCCAGHRCQESGDGDDLVQVLQAAGATR